TRLPHHTLTRRILHVSMPPPPPSSTLFPYTTLFRSTTRPWAASSGVHSDGSQPSESRPQRSSAAGTVPPSHTSSGCCTGTGESLTSRKLPTAPSWLTVSPAHRRRSSGSASSMNAPRCLGGTPIASRSGSYVSPGTSVTSSRPRQSTSRLASCFASRTTLRPG